MRKNNAVLLSLAAHGILILIASLFVVQRENEPDVIQVEWVKLPRQMRRIKTMEVKPVQPRVIKPRDLATHQVTPTAKPLDAKAAARRSMSVVEKSMDLSLDAPEAASIGDVKTDTQQPTNPHEVTLTRRAGNQGRDGTGMMTGDVDTRGGRGKGQGKGRMGKAMVEGTGTADGSSLEGQEFEHLETVPDGELGAILEGEGKDISGHIRLIRLKHSLSDWWQDPTAMPGFMKWLSHHTRLRADMKYKGGSLRLTEPKIQDAQLVFMTGHDKDIVINKELTKGFPINGSFSVEERAALRKYIVENGGMLFFDDCGYHGQFARQVAVELEKIFPDYPLKHIPHNHELYKIYFSLSNPPRGGDVYWNLPAQQYYPQPSKFQYQQGISIGNRLAVVYNRKDYMCSMETADSTSRPAINMRGASDVYRFMTNLLVYAMKYGGNTDRSNYQSLSQ